MSAITLVKHMVHLHRRIQRLETLETPAAAPGGGSVTHLETILISPAGKPITFSNIASTYTHLLFTGSIRSADPGEFDYLQVGFNGVAVPNAAYDGYLTYLLGGASSNVNSATRIIACLFGADGSPTDMFTTFEFWVFFYSRTDLNRQIKGQSAFGRDKTAPDIEAVNSTSSGHWNNVAAAINKVEFSTWAGAANFKAGSIISMYGVSGT